VGPEVAGNKLFEIFATYCITSQFTTDFDPEDLHAGESRDLRSPGAWRAKRAASARSGVNRWTHRNTVT